MKKIYLVVIAILLTSILYNCKKNDNIPTDIEVQNFVWKGLNAYYLWQGEISDLQDNRFISQEQLNNYLDGNAPKDLFENLLYKRGEIDKWSWIVTDYIALEQLFSGTTRNNGMEFGLVGISTTTEQIFGYVRYVIPNSNAAINGIQRGDIIYGVNGQQLTRTNYRNLLFSGDTYTVDFGTYSNANNTVIANGSSTTLTKEVLTENPVHTVITHNISGHKIGYLFYNQFVANFDTALNAAFLQLKNENVTDLVLDLRYNGGGSVQTAVNLASMITGQFNGQLFAKEKWNDKWQSFLEADHPNYLINNFTNTLKTGETINSLNLDKITIITTNSSASASELVINGLLPYIDVKLVGTKTHGKYVGSVTLYDSDDYTKSGANLNPNHNYAMQPLVLEILNKLDENDKDGFDPYVVLAENYENLGSIGDVNEPLLAEAISLITGTRRNAPITEQTRQLPTLYHSKSNHPMLSNMYVDLK